MAMMDRDLPREWCALERRARELVSTGCLDERRGFRLAQFVVEPSFVAPESFEIFDHSDALESLVCCVVRTSWDESKDQASFDKLSATPLARYCHPQALTPTIEVAARDLTERQLQDLKSMLAQMVLPLKLQRPVAVADSVRYTLNLDVGSFELTLRWVEGCDSGWEPLTAAFNRIVADLRKCFD